MVIVRVIPKRFLTRSKQVLGRFAGGVNSLMPPSPRRNGGQTEIDRIAAGIKHQAQCALVIFVDQTGKLFFFRVSPVGQAPARPEPMDFGIRIELFLA